MMERTDRDFRLLIRQLTRHTLLYTEMVTTSAMLRAPDDERWIATQSESPIALQLGGDCPAELARCAELAESLGYDEVNLNVGCPSSRVQKGRIGAILMLDPGRVAECIAEMNRHVSLPVTVKHRTGVDDQDDFATLTRFVDRVANVGVKRLSIHARKAWLNGLSPHENRTIPPLHYDWVYQIKRERPDLCIEINGGVLDLDAAQEHLLHVDAVMIGRAAWDHPYLFAQADSRIFGVEDPRVSRETAVIQLLPYLELQAERGAAWSRLLRPILNLYAGQTGGRRWRRNLSEGATQRRHSSFRDLVLEALAQMSARNVETRFPA